MRANLLTRLRGIRVQLDDGCSKIFGWKGALMKAQNSANVGSSNLRGVEQEHLGFVFINLKT